MGHLQTMKNTRLTKYLFLRGPHGRRSAERPRIRWLDIVQKGLYHLVIDNWRDVAMARDQFNRLKKAFDGL